MKLKSLITTLLLISAAAPLSASRLMELKVVDQDYLMLVFRDGEAIFTDDAKRASAYFGHSFAEGDDRMVWFGEKLDVDAAGMPSSWMIISEQDKNYGKNGKTPVEVYRKSKVWHTTHDWEYAHDHTLYLKLPVPMQNGASYTVEIDQSTNSDKPAESITFDIFSSQSEAVHVNILGYVPDGPVKAADLYLWMGDGGPRDYRDFEGNTIWLFNTSSGEKTEVGTVSYWMSKDVKTEIREWNLTGSDVWNADFSGFSTPGTYRLVIDKVGCSMDFRIADDVYFEPYQYSVRGYYYMRVGEDRFDMVPVPRRPLFIEGRDPSDTFRIYLTDLHPWHPNWRDYGGDTWDEPHHLRAVETGLFWNHRLEGLPTNPKVRGGHSDAADWDRHLAHVSNIYDLLFPYLLSGGKLNDDDLNIGESGNGIPDLIDEARNEVDFFLSMKTEYGYGHGITCPTNDYRAMFQAAPTPMAAWANSANCAMMAEAFQLLGNSELESYYTIEAVEAFEHAESLEDRQLDTRQGIGDESMTGRDFRMMAAAYLYNVTGDTRWEDIMAGDSYAGDGVTRLDRGRRGQQIWGSAAYLLTPQERHYPELAENMEASILDQVEKEYLPKIAERPSRRCTNNQRWVTAQNLHLVILAHALTDDAAKKSAFERAMLLEADWGLGRNPGNIVEMTGLGQRHIVNCYTTGLNDGTPGVHPGQTPYNNLGHWGGTHNGSHPEWYTEHCYPDWEESGWPRQDAHFNSRYAWANGEFTPRQTMRGKLLLYAYLQSIYDQ
jgi:hypothetical protein